MKTIPIIDSHIHVFDLEKLRIQWMEMDPTLFPSLRRSFSLSDYLKASQGFTVEKAIHVEVNVVFDQLKQENDEILKLCESKDSIIEAMVISGDVGSSSFEEYIKPYADNPYIKGVRRVLLFQDTPPGYCLQPQFVKNVQLLGSLGLSFDICMRPAELMDMVQLIDLCPDTSFILDHVGNIGARASGLEYEAWLKAIQEMGKKNVTCKISGMVEQIDGPWKIDDLRPNIETCLKIFGEDRVLFASNWPVCNLNTDFKRWVKALQEIIPENIQQKFFHDNALRIYKL